MNWADYGIIAIVILSLLVGLLRGFTREVFGLGTWVLAILMCVLFGPSFAEFLRAYLQVPLVRTGVAYGGLFLAGLLIGGILTALLVARVRESKFSSADRTLGSGIGLVRGILLVGLVVLLARTAGMKEEPWWQASTLIPPSQVIADGLDVLIPDAWLEPLKPDPLPPSPSAPDDAKPATPAASV